MINSRNIGDLNPKVQVLAELFLSRCVGAGLDIIITSTFRDSESQSALWAQGRTTKGSKVTNAKAGQSFHNYRIAFDFGVIVNGKYQKDDKGGLYTKAGIIAESVGLEWAGRWKSFREMAHCQYTDGLTLADLQAGKHLA